MGSKTRKLDSGHILSVGATVNYTVRARDGRHVCHYATRESLDELAERLNREHAAKIERWAEEEAND